MPWLKTTDKYNRPMYKDDESVFEGIWLIYTDGMAPLYQTDLVLRIEATSAEAFESELKPSLSRLGVRCTTSYGKKTTDLHHRFENENFTKVIEWIDTVSPMPDDMRNELLEKTQKFSSKINHVAAEGGI